MSWEKHNKGYEGSFLNFPTSGGGILFPPCSLYKDILDKNLFMKLSPTADDVWIWAMAVMNNTPIKTIKDGYQILTYVNPQRETGPLTDEKTLYFTNKRGNDVQLKNVVNHYPEIQTKLQKEIPKVSVIIPVYNTGKYLEKCLGSVLNQTLEDIEVICINDGSTDNSLEILRRYEKKKRRIKIINQKNQGGGVARNKGLEIAKGEYISFIDSDDWISEDYLEVLYQNAKKFNADISATSQAIFFPGKGKKDVGFDGTKPLQSIDSKRKMILASGVIWNKIYKRKFIIKNKICFSSRKSIGEDNIFNIFGVILSNYIVTTNKVNYYYRQRKNSSLSKKKKTEIDILLLNDYQDILNKLQGG